MSKTYRTVQGDTWDMISLNQYGSELFTKDLVEANPTYRKTLVFGAGTTLVIPDVSAQQRQQSIAPPWRRNT